MFAPLLASAIAVILLAIDLLAFHDMFEAHTFRDWLTLVASLLVFVYLARDLARSNRLRARRR
jgi:uncharacterized membrane protein (DUF2068 family)